jgi:hypothetical protein
MVRAKWTEDEVKSRLEEIRSRTMKNESSDPPIKELCERILKGKLDLHADFQRKYVWENKNKIKSKLIESVLLKVPIPVIYTAELDDGKEVVVDGQQRLNTFLDFRRQDGFKLSGLEILDIWNGSRYSDLPQEIQDAIDSYPIRVIKILKDTIPDVKYDVFERLNRGSVPLNDQEIRNCIYRGSFNDTIKELTEFPVMLEIQGLEEPHLRMKDAERILRFFAFADKGLQSYNSKITTFLNEYMKDRQNISPDEILQKKDLLKKCAEMCKEAFGPLSGHKWMRKSEAQPDGGPSSGFNEGVFDAQLFGFIDYQKRDIVPALQMIRDAFIDLNVDPMFVETTEQGTYDTAKTKMRMELWVRKLREVLGYPGETRRFYTSEEKQILFERQNGICGICKNRILDIDDAHVDHIVRFSEGGDTSLENAQLTHRFCNLQKH